MKTKRWLEVCGSVFCSIFNPVPDECSFAGWKPEPRKSRLVWRIWLAPADWESLWQWHLGEKQPKTSFGRPLFASQRVFSSIAILTPTVRLSVCFWSSLNGMVQCHYQSIHIYLHDLMPHSWQLAQCSMSYCVTASIKLVHWQLSIFNNIMQQRWLKTLGEILHAPSITSRTVYIIFRISLACNWAEKIITRV